MLFRCVPVPRGRFSHISLIPPGFNTERSCVFVGNLHLQTRTVMCTAIYGQPRSDKIMGGLSQEDVEAFLHVTMVAILADCNFYNNSVTKR